MGDDDALFDAKDLADMFGAEDEKDSSAELAKGLEDLFSSDEEEGGDDFAKAAAALAEAPELPPTAAPARPPAPEHEELEPEPAEPDRGGLNEEEWRASPGYSEFKKQVIARHLKKKALEEARGRAAIEAEARAKHESELAAKAAAEAQAQAAQDEAGHKAAEEAERRKQDLLDKYKAAKAATIAQRAQAMVQASEAEAPKPGDEAAKEEQFKAYLAQMKEKMAKGGGAPKLALSSERMAPTLSAASKGLEIDVLKAKALANMLETTRLTMYKLIADAIGKKPAQAMFKKTLAKVAKPHLDVYGRAALDANNELRVDGALDEDKLSRAIYALPAPVRLAKVQKAFYELIEMRFIAIELGMGIKQKGVVVSKMLDLIDHDFKSKGYGADLIKWYMDDVIPSTTLNDGDDA